MPVSPPQPPQRGPRGGRRQPRGAEPGPPAQRRPIPLWFVMAAFLLLAAIWWASRGGNRREIGYGEFRTLVKQGSIKTCVITPTRIEGELLVVRPDGGPVRFVTVDGESHTTKLDSDPVRFTAAWDQGDEDIYKLLDEAEVEYRIENQQLRGFLLLWILPIAIIIIVWRMLFSRMNPAGRAMDFAQSRARMFTRQEGDVSFDDVAGIDECKEELQEVIGFLQDPGKFTRLGGKIPRGVLLVGEPGTGKTLLARAVAGEAGVPFFSLSGSDFVEMFVGVGAARVRDLFEQAAKHAPCIIFIDELDALAKARGMGMMGGHEEREQTLNALLVQMDGFETTKGIIMLAATNRPEMLDPALLRPGRFDRQVTIPRPDLQGREEILALHARDVKLASDVDLRKVAALTPGFVGADLANLVNEAALLAARTDKQTVGTEEFEASIERVVAGLKRPSRLINPEEKSIVAHHEAGHALTACLLPGADPVRKVSMIARGVAGLGYTMQMPLEDRYLLRKTELMDRLAVLLAGRSAEEVVFEEVSTGAQNDLVKATELARRMVLDFGMSEQLGPLSFPREAGANGAGMPLFHKPWSERTNRDIDNAIKELVWQAHQRALELVREHKDALEAIAAALMEKEALDQDELQDVLTAFGLHVKDGALPDGETDGETAC